MTEEKDAAKLLNGSALAYVGDAVTEVFVRSSLVSLGITDTGRYSELSRLFVTAHAQSGAYAKIADSVTEEEKQILLRGRNAHLTHRPKNQTQSDYRRATGFEALIGYLYLSKNTERARELFDLAYIDVLDGIRNKEL